MKPDIDSLDILNITRSKAKMFEYNVDFKDQIKLQIDRHPSRLFDISIGILGDLTYLINETPFEGDELDNLDNSTVQFSAQFFDSYLKARLNEEMNPYLLLVGAASYYLCDLPGSTRVLINQLKGYDIDLEARGIEDLLHWILEGEFSSFLYVKNTIFENNLIEIYEGYRKFYKTGAGINELLKATDRLRKESYEYGTARELLFADVICALTKKRLRNSVWFSLPEYSKLPLEVWRNSFEKDSFIQELWPAQHMIGKEGIFKGDSGLIQMPTSAGKTKATEIIVRSAFLSTRTSLAIIVAPFRALCNEISTDLKTKFYNEEISVNEMTDVFQMDFEIADIIRRKQILVVTPEKLLYILRNSPELSNEIGLIIYDEGHQFDNGSRGTTYELLLTSLKFLIPENAQSILISAIINNVDSLNEWLNGEKGAIILGNNLLPTYRTLALVRWYEDSNDLVFFSIDKKPKLDFHVPNVLMEYPLKLSGRELRERFFPDKSDAHSIALFLGVKLVGKGAVAIFSERKDSINLMCNLIIDAYKRGFSFPTPVEESDFNEIKRLHFLYEKNLGVNSTTLAAKIGILTHHGDIPRGIRISVEYAMRKGLAKYLICTSTLAQGVNLPIRYLILSKLNPSPRYGGLRVRDFHNLIGRVGRSGMHTEGSIIFADPEILKNYVHRGNDRKWKQINTLLNPDNSESISSSLLNVFKPLYADKGDGYIEIDVPYLVKMNYENTESVDDELQNIALENEKYSFDGLRRQVLQRLNVISSVESFLMANWENSFDEDENEIDELAKKTLAHFLTTEESDKKNDDIAQEIIKLFRVVAKNISDKIPENKRKKDFGTTLYGTNKVLGIEAWVFTYVLEINECGNEEDLLKTIWPLLEESIQNNYFNNFNKPEILQDMAINWMNSIPYVEIIGIEDIGEIMVGQRNLTMNHIVGICDNAFAYDATLVIASVIKVIESHEMDVDSETIERLKLLQKNLKYGLRYKKEIAIFELGFSDRIISNEIYSLLDENYINKNSLIAEIKSNRKKIEEKLTAYPSYFSNVLINVLE